MLIEVKIILLNNDNIEVTSRPKLKLVATLVFNPHMLIYEMYNYIQLSLLDMSYVNKLT